MADSRMIAVVRKKFEALRPIMDERMRRHWAACEAVTLGWGGVSTVAEATGLSRTTINAGVKELQEPVSARDGDSPRQRIRQPGGGRRRLTQEDRALLKDLVGLLESTTRGDPQSPLR